LSVLVSIPASGLSPRVRGHRPQRHRWHHQLRSIPACAGASPTFGFTPVFQGVYPRVCGGISEPLQVGDCNKGLSPRVRGHRAASSQAPCATGSIPACAGASQSKQPTNNRLKVYPRVCGGIKKRPFPSSTMTGLSPRVRGHRLAGVSAPKNHGSIPACAGASQSPRMRGACPTVYPRVCGGILSDAVLRIWFEGLSPRVRGHLLCLRR